jgi:hypothetical protein
VATAVRNRDTVPEPAVDRDGPAPARRPDRARWLVARLVDSDGDAGRPRPSIIEVSSASSGPSSVESPPPGGGYQRFVTLFRPA